MKAVTLLLPGAAVVCAYTVTTAERFMLKNIDPIVVPGQYISHMHSFFGSDAVTVNTTTSEELQAGCSTAENPNDYSIYWVPLLAVRNDTGATAVPMSRFSAYYVAIESAEVAIPQDYRSLAGNSKASSQNDVEDLAGIQWFCEGDATEEDKDLAAFPTKTCSTHLQTLLLFHDCVDEETLESDYSGTQHWTDDFKPENRCPPGMKRMPQLRFSIRYDLRSVLPNGWDGAPPLELACGPSYCSHGAFINGWLPEAAENMLLANDKREFQGVDGPAGSYNAGSLCGAENAQDADPENGTSDYEESIRILDQLAAGNETTSLTPTPTLTPTPSVSAADAATSSATTEDLVIVEATTATPGKSTTAPPANSPTTVSGSTECKAHGKRHSKRHNRGRF